MPAFSVCTYNISCKQGLKYDMAKVADTLLYLSCINVCVREREKEKKRENLYCLYDKLKSMTIITIPYISC